MKKQIVIAVAVITATITATFAMAGVSPSSCCKTGNACCITQKSCCK